MSTTERTRTRIITSSDWHLDAITRGIVRRGEVEAAVVQSTTHAARIMADLYVFAGDLCDPDDGAQVALASAFAIKTAKDLSHNGIESLWIAGNHDVVHDDARTTTLTPLRHLNDPLVTVCEAPTIIRLGENVIVIALPFESKTSILPADAFNSFMVHPIIGVDPSVTHVVVIGHLTVPGAQPGEETTEMPRGREILFPHEVISEWKQAHPRVRVTAVNGHYHRAMTVTTPSGLDVVIPGSLARLTFGEQAHTPSFLDISLGVE